MRFVQADFIDQNCIYCIYCKKTNPENLEQNLNDNLN